MPRYEYRCGECGHVQDLFGIPVSRRDEPVMCNASAAHPDTGAPVRCVRLVAVTGGFSLKGGGWYKDGYQKDKP